MMDALAKDAVEQVHHEYDIKGRVEGSPREGWVLVDFGDVILHLFSPERRGYYRLEDLWGKGRVVLHLQ